MVVYVKVTTSPSTISPNFHLAKSVPLYVGSTPAIFPLKDEIAVQLPPSYANPAGARSLTSTFFNTVCGR